ncbi:MAG: MerR family transcriptional regulator [Candidatus Limnocylindrales bacterium]
MNVSELARRAGVAPGTIRFYERAGVLPDAQRQANGYRRYDEPDLCRLRVVVSLRALGLALEESGRLADQCATGRCDDMATDLLPRLIARRVEVATARAELDHLDRELARLEASFRAGEPSATLDLERRTSVGVTSCCCDPDCPCACCK